MPFAPFCTFLLLLWSFLAFSLLFFAFFCPLVASLLRYGSIFVCVQWCSVLTWFSFSSWSISKCVRPCSWKDCGGACDGRRFVQESEVADKCPSVLGSLGVMKQSFRNIAGHVWGISSSWKSHQRGTGLGDLYWWHFECRSGRSLLMCAGDRCDAVVCCFVTMAFIGQHLHPTSSSTFMGTYPTSRMQFSHLGRLQLEMCSMAVGFYLVKPKLVPHCFVICRSRQT